MHIGDAEKATGMDRATIRFYEKEGYLSPKRQENGYRDYTQGDVELLLKLKLLRQLGFSLEKIERLQQGSEDFATALSEQIQNLSKKIRRNQASVQVCKEMSSDQADYQSLNTQHYLNRHRQIMESDELPSSKPFKESLPIEPPHPWRRFFARLLDYSILSYLIQFILFVVLRIRPMPGNFLNILLSIGIGILMIPIEALFLSKFGTTPGKMLMGISLEDEENGRYLSYGAALVRSGDVFLFGVGLYLPIIGLITSVYQYCVLTGRSIRRFAKYNEVNEPAPMAWDEGITATYCAFSGKRIIALICSIALITTISLFTVTDSVKPRYRGSELTLEQFSENYNAFLKYIENDSLYPLKEDGRREVPPEDPYTAVIYINGEEDNINGEYRYEMENGFLRTVVYENTWKEPFYLEPIDDAAITPAITLLLSQKGCGVKELEEFTQLLNQKLDTPVGTVTYRNISVSWEITLGNGQYFNNQVIFAGDSTNPVSVVVSATVSPVH